MSQNLTGPDKLTNLAEEQENLKNDITLAYKIAPQTTSTNALAAFSKLKLYSTEFTRKTLENYHHQNYTQTLATNANEQRAIARVVAELKSAFNKGDEATLQHSKKSTNDMLNRFAVDSDKAVHILQTYKLKIIDMEHQLKIIDKKPELAHKADASTREAIVTEITFTKNLVEKLQIDLQTLPNKRSSVTNTMSQKSGIERFAHTESHNNLCKELIRSGKDVETDRFVHMTNASFEMMKNYLGDALAIMASTPLDDSINNHLDIGMHACPLLCVVPTDDTISKIYEIVSRLHDPYQPNSDAGGILVDKFSGQAGIGKTNVSTSSGISSGISSPTASPMRSSPAASREPSLARSLPLATLSDRRRADAPPPADTDGVRHRDVDRDRSPK